MFVQRVTRAIISAAVVICMTIAFTGVVPRALAQAGQVDLNAADAMRQTLQQQVGKRVKLKLSSGQDLEGQLAKVGTQAVALTELTGVEFFDATVRLDEVAAVIVRRGK